MSACTLCRPMDHEHLPLHTHAHPVLACLPSFALFLPACSVKLETGGMMPCAEHGILTGRSRSKWLRHLGRSSLTGSLGLGNLGEWPAASSPLGLVRQGYACLFVPLLRACLPPLHSPSMGGCLSGFIWPGTWDLTMNNNVAEETGDSV